MATQVPPQYSPGRLHRSMLALLLCAVGATIRTAAALSYDDIVVALPVDEAHMELAKASRGWRQGMRTLIASNTYPSAALVEEGKRYNETWVFYPDDNPLRSLYAGDSRAALVPFLAHQAFGDTYKWILYGDDDTVFFPDAVLRLLQPFNASLPYFVTDHLWWTSGPDVKPMHPNMDAPRCLPCHFDDSGMDKSKAKWEAPKGCPCTPKLLCETDKRGIFNEYCDIPRAPKVLYSMHGGAGGLMSVGLMQAIPFEWMQSCVKSLFSTGGDAFISICLWQAGYAHTDPGPSFYKPELQQMDPGPEDRMGVMMRIARALDQRCDEPCMEALDGMLTLHVRSRMFPRLEDAGHFIKGVSTMYENYRSMRRFHEAAVAAARQAELAELAETAAEAKAAEEARPRPSRRKQRMLR